MGIGKNTLIGLSVDALVFGLGIVVSIVLTRSLGPEQRGIYVLLFTTNILLSGLAHLGVGTALSTMLARGRYRIGEANAIALILAFAAGLSCLILVSLVFPWLADNVFQGVSFQYVLIAVALIPGTIYQVYWNGIMIGTDHVFLLNKVNLTVNTINALLMIMAVGVLQMGIPGFLYAWIISSVSGLALTVFLAGRLQPWEWPRRESVARILGFGLRSHGQQVAHQLFLRFDVYAVKVLAGAAGVGFYSLSTSLAEKLWLPLNAIHASSLGRIAGMPRDDSALLTARVMRAAILIMASVAIPFGLISPWLIPFVYGAEFSASVLPLIILLVGTMGFAVMFVANSFIIGQLERPGLLSLVSWLQLVVSIPMYIALILWLGIIGAAIASSVTYLVAMSITLSIFKGASGLKLSAMLVPRRSDFSDYMRIVKPIKDKVGLWARRVRHTPQP